MEIHPIKAPHICALMCVSTHEALVGFFFFFYVNCANRNRVHEPEENRRKIHLALCIWGALLVGPSPTRAPTQPGPSDQVRPLFTRWKRSTW